MLARRIAKPELLERQGMVVELRELVGRLGGAAFGRVSGSNSGIVDESHAGGIMVSVDMLEQEDSWLPDVLWLPRRQPQ
jgi:hypothetical protein